MAYETSEQLLAEISDYWYKQPDGNMFNLIDAFNEPLEAISTSAKKVEHWRAFKDAKGTTLDLFGGNIQAYRPSQDDDNYKFIIHIMELLSRAQGTIPSLVKIISQAMNAEPSILEVYQTGLRHIGLKIPWENVQTLQIQKFITRNIQNLIAMGYWIDEVKFIDTFHANDGFLGTKLLTHEYQSLKAI